MKPRNRACLLLMGFFFFVPHMGLCQDQKIADSLKIIYLENELDNNQQLKLLRDLSFNEMNDLDLSLKYSQELIDLSLKMQDYLYLHRGYLQKGNKKKLKGDMNEALKAFFKSAEAAIEGKYIEGEGTAYISIADTYSEMSSSENAELYYVKGIQILRKTTDSISLATALLNAGDEAFSIKKYDLALEYFEESGSIFKKINYNAGIAYNLGNLGMVYAEQGKDILAEKNINKAISILETLEDYYAIAVYLTYMSDIYLRKNDFNAALDYSHRSLYLAKNHGLKEQIRDANFKLYELYLYKDEFEKSLSHLKDYHIYRDSIINIEAVEDMANLRTEYEVSQKQTEVDLLSEKQRNQRLTIIATLVGLGLIMVLAFGLYRRNRFIQRTSKIIETERDRSDRLLLNILPEETAKELKDKGEVQAQKFQSVSVLFTDFKGFTKLSADLSPEELVDSVNYYYSTFDEIMAKYGLEKIKTVGDAYMAAGGLPFPSEDHALKLVKAALEIIDFVKRAKEQNPNNSNRFEIRIGINSGPVVAGVVGTRKFAYDIWGDTVNIASRMESNSESGKINISESTYQLIKDEFNCIYRGEIEVKNKGQLKMYFVDEIQKTAVV